MWLDEDTDDDMRPGFGPQPVDAFVTRLHVRYDAETFPEDLEFQVTGDRSNYQGRYVLRHPWRGDYGECEAAGDYAVNLVERWDDEANQLAKLTGRDFDAIKTKMASLGYSDAILNNVSVEPKEKKNWWQKLWGN